ncbi:hypothetical protein C0995_004370 [Termitomyces sp. Mi166|nr:hypothetical protein C0995_004370 [Termitomyces sp. Mi166\
MPFLGVTMHFIKVDPISGKWSLASEVISFKMLSGAHSEHVMQLSIVNVMSCLTKTGAIENTNVIWDYNPDLPANQVLNGRLDVIAALWTIAIKIQASGQCMEYFQKLQMQTRIKTLLKIPLHNDTRWGSAYGMMDHSLKLHPAITQFVGSADVMYGPITIVWKEGHIEKCINWSVFTFNEEDWSHVDDAKEILSDSKKCLHYFSSEEHPTLYKVIPAIEALLTAWENKLEHSHYKLYSMGLCDGCTKLSRYYNYIDDKPTMVLALILHPYYKLDYIQMEWGSEEEQRAEIATDIVALCWMLITKDEAEMHSYLKNVCWDVTKDTNPVVFWSNNKNIHPTVAHIALNVLPAQAFSKQTATNCHAQLGPVILEQLQILKAAWRNDIVDLARQNAEEIEVVYENEDTLKVYQTLLKEDVDLEAFKKELDDLSD